MKAWLLVILVAAVAGFAQEQQPLASFTGTVRQIDSSTLTLARPDEEDLEIYCGRKTRYFSGSRRIKREEVKPGDRVSVETKLDLNLKPEAVNVRVLPPEKEP